MLVGCECGKSKKVSIESDYEYGQYYVIIVCDECGYYWEGYMGICEEISPCGKLLCEDCNDYPCQEYFGPDI